MSRQMKDSGIPWIGAIPETWDVIRTKNVFECSKELVGEDWKNTQLLSLTTKGIKAVEIGSTSGKVPDSYETYQKVAKDKIVMCLFDLDCSAVFSGLSLICGMISPAYKVLNVLDGYCPKFYSYWFDYIFDGRKYKYLSKNIRYSLTYDEFAALGIAAPPLEEQRHIADFLDQKCDEVDGMVSLQEQIIEELKAYKQAIITEAVCKGLNQNVEMKDSGVEWIGKIPEGWEVIKVKYLANSFSKGNGITKEEVFADGDTPCVRYGEIYSKYDYSFSECVSFTKKDALSSLHYFHKGDILFAGTGELVEEIGKNIVYLGDSPCLAGGDIIILNHNQNPLFLNFALNSYAQIQKSKGKAKLKVVHISASEIGSLYIALPPLSEQQQIANYINQKCTEINSLVAIKQQKIEELKDYKKSIIYEYITGKKEVV